MAPSRKGERDEMTAASTLAVRSGGTAVQMTVADAVVAQLHAWGVRYAFGVTGDAILHLVDAIERHPDMHYIDMHHEEAAALAASAYGKVTGQLAACIATSGPGAAHLVNGLADARSDRVPVLALTGQVERQYVGTGHKQYINQQMLFAAVTAFSAAVPVPEHVLTVLARALRTALAAAGPSHIEIPKDLWSLTACEAVRMPEPYLHALPESAASVVQGAAERLAPAERPVLYAGRGASGAVKELLELAEHLQAPVVRTLGAAGRVNGFHPLVVGGIGEGGTEAAGQLMAESDCIVRVGATYWPGEWITGSAEVLAIDVAPTQLGAGVAPVYGVVGDAAQVLRQLRAETPPGNRPAWGQRVRELKAAWERRIAAEVAAPAFGIHPACLVRVLETEIPTNAVIVLDVGEHVVWFNRIFRGSGQDILLSGNWRTMGFGLPAALAARLAHADRPVVALVGDGGAGMMLAEFASLAKHRLPVVVVIANNGCLALERHALELSGLRPAGAYLHNPDFVAYARACGGLAWRARSAAELSRAMQEALASDMPALIDAAVSADPVPTVSARASGDKRPKPE